MRSCSFRTSTGTIVYTGHWSCHGMDTQRTQWSCLPLILMWLCQCSAAAIAAIACPCLHSMMTAWVWQYALPRNPCIDSGRWFCSQSVFDVYRFCWRARLSNCGLRQGTGMDLLFHSFRWVYHCIQLGYMIVDLLMVYALYQNWLIVIVAYLSHLSNIKWLCSILQHKQFWKLKNIKIFIVFSRLWQSTTRSA